MARFCSVICAALLAVNVASAQFDAAPLTSNQWVQPTDAGTLVGRIVLPSGDGMAQAVEGASVLIASVDGGGVSGRAVTDDNGDFTITGVTPGVYSVISRAENAFARTVIHVIDSTADVGGRYPDLAEIASTDMSFEAVQATVLRYRPPSSERVITMANADLDALANRVINDETFRVEQFDGGLNGQLYVAGADGPNLIPAPMTNVFLMKNGVEVGRAITNQVGDFRIEVLELGNYSLLAIGREGMTAISFDLVAAADGDVARRTADGKRLVAKSKAANAFGCQLDPFISALIREKEKAAQQLPNRNLPQFGASPAGGGYSSGGGGGAGGGFGDIAGLAGIGAAIAIAASSDDDDGIRDAPLPATPVLP